jgi:hypothetical protein
LPYAGTGSRHAGRATRRAAVAGLS